MKIRGSEQDAGERPIRTQEEKVDRREKKKQNKKKSSGEKGKH